MEQVRAAVIGFGGMGRQYAEMIRDGRIGGMVLAGVCCRNEQGQELLKKEYPGVLVYRDVDEMVSRQAEYDAAVIVTPHASHVEIGLRMVEAGKHILVDKPAGVCAGEVRRLVDEAKRRGQLWHDL